MADLTLEEQVVWRVLATDLGFTVDEIVEDLDGLKVDVDGVLNSLGDKGLLRQEGERFLADEAYEDLK